MPSKPLLVALGLLAGWVIHLQGAQPAPKAPDGAQARFGEWRVVLAGGGGSQAFATHASGQELGVLCGADDCVAYLKPAEPCEEGDQVPAVFRIDEDVVRTRLVCTELGDGVDPDARWIAEEARLPKQLALAQERLAVAQPELGGRGVAVTQFAIDGADMAIMAVLIYTSQSRRSGAELPAPFSDGIISRLPV